MLRETTVGMLSSLKDSLMCLMYLNQIVLILPVFSVSKLVVLHLWISFDYKPGYFKCDSTSEIYAVFCCFIVSGILCYFETLNTSTMLTPKVCFERFQTFCLCVHIFDQFWGGIFYNLLWTKYRNCSWFWTSIQPIYTPYGAYTSHTGGPPHSV